MNKLGLLIDSIKTNNGKGKIKVVKQTKGSNPTPILREKGLDKITTWFGSENKGMFLEDKTT